MSYLVLARRFRPQTFGSIVGQEHISTALANAIVRNRLPHALLLCGPRGVGKTTTARVLARALNCTGRELLENIVTLSEEESRAAVEPCGECTNCKEIAKSVSLAVQEIDGASNNSVDNVRDLIESLKGLPPPGCNYKIYIIDEVHMLSTAAFNALLKSLEEPPPHTIFMFATTDPQKVPDTVISRCQLFEFRRLPSIVIVNGLKEILKAEKFKVEEAVLHFIARRADGGMRDAQSMLDRLLAFSSDTISLEFAQEIFGAVHSELMYRLAEHILAGEPDEALTVLGKVFGRSVDTKQFLADFVVLWRDLLIISGHKKKEGLSALIEKSEDELQKLSSLVRGKELFDLERLFRLANETVESALMSTFPRFVIEAGVVRMALLPTLKPLAQILSGTSSSTIKSEGPDGEVVRDTSRPKPKPAIEEIATSVQAVEEFNPSWIDFVRSVKNSSEQVLAAFLRRVTPRKFADNVLELTGNAFDLNSLREGSQRETLLRMLESYSGTKGWRLNLIEQGAATPVPGKKSIAEIEAEVVRDRQTRISDEAKNHPLIRSALSMFEGSKIDRIAVLDEEN